MVRGYVGYVRLLGKLAKSQSQSQSQSHSHHRQVVGRDDSDAPRHHGGHDGLNIVPEGVDEGHSEGEGSAEVGRDVFLRAGEGLGGGGG